MEYSSSRLYSVPLSEAAQKVLVALRAQNLHAARHNHIYSYSHSGMERDGSVREHCTQSTRSIGQEERRDRNTDRSQVLSFSTSHHKPSNQSSQTLAYCQYSRTPDSSLSPYTCWDSPLQRQTSETEAYYQRSQMYPHRKYSESPVYQAGQALSFTQHEVYETTASFSHGNRHTGSLQIPKRLPDQATFWRKSTVDIRPSFILTPSLDNECPSEVMCSTMENPKTHKEVPVLAYHPISSCLKVSVETNNGTSGGQKEKKGTKCRTVLVNDVEDVVSDSQLKWKQPLSDHTDKATIGGLRKQSKSETSQTGRIHLCSGGFLPRQDTNSPKSVRDLVRQEGVEFVVNTENMTKAGTGLMSDTDCEMEVGRNGASEEESDSVLPNEKISTSENEDILFLGTNEDTNLESSLYLETTSNMDISTGCNSGRQRFVETEVNRCNFSAFEIKEAEHPQGSEKEALTAGNNSGGLLKITPLLLSGNHKVGPCRAESPQVSGQSVIETEENDQTRGTVVQCVPAKFILVDTNPKYLARTRKERVNMMEIGLEVDTESRAKADINIDIEAEQPHCSVVQTKQRQCEYKLVSDLTGGDTGPGESRKDGDESGVVVVDSEGASLVDSEKEKCPTPMLSQEYKAKGQRIKVTCHQTTNGYIRGSVVTSAFASGQNSSSVDDLNSTAIKTKEKLENSKIPTSQTHSHNARLVPLFPLKRKHEVLQDQNGSHPQKIHLIKRPPKWEPPCSSQEKAGEGKVSTWKRAKPKTSILEHPAVPRQPLTKVSSCTEPHVPKQTQQKKSKIDHRGHKFDRSTSKHTPCSVTCKKHKQGKREPDETRATTGCLTTLICDPRIKDSGKLNQDEKMQLLEEVGQAKTLVLTMVYEDGATQLDPEQKFTPPVCGLLVLMKNDLDCSTPEEIVGPNGSLVYLRLQQKPIWAQQHTHERQKLFTRDVLLQVLSRSQLVVCYKTKDLLCTALQFYKQDLNWKQVAGCHIHDPQVSGWLLDPADPSSCYQDLFMKYCKKPCKKPVLGSKKASQVISDLSSLYLLNKELCSKLQSQGLWELYSNMELKMIPILAAMESHCIHVDKEALKITSDLLGTKMKQLEQEAHQAAGQMFLVTSNSQLRTVLFEKLRLHERCENKKLPKTINKQQQSTSEATLLQLQDLHPLPKVILEYRQVHKIKSTFVDGILSCMMNKSYISSTWHQTCVVTGRISAKHPNFQALPRQPLQITKKPYIQGKEQEVVTVHPRAMFTPQDGWTFLAADFCQVELRLLAHFSSDPELLHIFTNPQVDVFTMLACQWKGVSEGEVTPDDREHAKRIVYSVVYGAGRTRLSGILGVSAEQARQFQDSFLQTYREVQTFIQRTILQCHKQGYVLSIMGRRRTLTNINSPDWGIRMQAERQAVNFVVQGSAADLCKMAMIRIFKLVSSSSSLSARLIAQLHDELLYEVEDSQVEHFAALVKSTMESLQHIHHFGVHLKVPLKVAVSSGKSWGSMSELNIPSTPTARL